MSVEFLSPVLNESVSAVTSTNSVDVGTRRGAAGNEYIYVYNAGNSAINPGFGAVISATTGYSVTVSSVTASDFLIGICKHATISTAQYGWLLTKGFSSFSAGASDSFAVGAPLCIAVDGAFANKTQSTGYQTPVVGKCISASASGLTNTGYAFFRII